MEQKHRQHFAANKYVREMLCLSSSVMTTPARESSPTTTPQAISPPSGDFLQVLLAKAVSEAFGFECSAAAQSKK